MARAAKSNSLVLKLVVGFVVFCFLAKIITYVALGVALYLTLKVISKI